MSDIAYFLVIFILFAKVICILKNKRPMETTFKYFMGCSFRSKMPTTRMRMTKSVKWNEIHYVVHIF